MCETKATLITSQHLGLHQRPHTLFQEKRIPFCPLNEELFEGFQPWVVSKQGFKKLTGLHATYSGPSEGLSTAWTAARAAALTILMSLPTWHIMKPWAKRRVASSGSEP